MIFVYNGNSMEEWVVFFCFWDISSFVCGKNTSKRTINKLWCGENIAREMCWQFIYIPKLNYVWDEYTNLDWLLEIVFKGYSEGVFDYVSEFWYVWVYFIVAIITIQDANWVWLAINWNTDMRIEYIQHFW